MDKLELTLSSPITEEQMDAITDVDFDNTSRIWFHTKHGKTVEFVKRKHGKWMEIRQGVIPSGYCSECEIWNRVTPYCPNCGARMVQ